MFGLEVRMGNIALLNSLVFTFPCESHYKSIGLFESNVIMVKCI